MGLFVCVFFFFSVSTTIIIHDPWLVESTGVEPQIQGAHCKVIHGFSTVPMTPMLLKGQVKLELIPT